MTNLVLLETLDDKTIRMSRISEKRITSVIDYDTTDSNHLEVKGTIEEYRINDIE